MGAVIGRVFCPGNSSAIAATDRPHATMPNVILATVFEKLAAIFLLL